MNYIKEIIMGFLIRREGLFNSTKSYFLRKLKQEEEYINNIIQEANTLSIKDLQNILSKNINLNLIWDYMHPLQFLNTYSFIIDFNKSYLLRRVNDKKNINVFGYFDVKFSFIIEPSEMNFSIPFSEWKIKRCTLKLYTENIDLKLKEELKDNFINNYLDKNIDRKNSDPLTINSSVYSGRFISLK